MLVETSTSAGSSATIVAFGDRRPPRLGPQRPGRRRPGARSAQARIVTDADTVLRETRVVTGGSPPTTWHRPSMDDTAEEKASGPRPPSFLDALAPVVVLIVLLTLTIVLFGTAAADGPLQVALFTSAVFAGLVAFKNGYTAATLREAAIGGVSSAMGALFILLAVGALIGTWNMAGTIPTVVSYGIAHPQAGDLLRRRRPDLRRGRGSHRKLMDDRRHARRGLHRHGTDPRPVDDHRRRGDHLRRLHGRQDVAAVGDHRAGAQPRRGRDRQRAHPGDDVDGRAVVRPRVRRLPRDRRASTTRPRRRSAPTRRATSSPRRSTSRRSTCCRSSC